MWQIFTETKQLDGRCFLDWQGDYFLANIWQGSWFGDYLARWLTGKLFDNFVGRWLGNIFKTQSLDFCVLLKFLAQQLQLIALHGQYLFANSFLVENRLSSIFLGQIAPPMEIATPVGQPDVSRGRHTNVFANASFTKWREANKKYWTGTILLLLQGLYCYCTIIVSNIFRYLTENYGKDARVTTIVDTTEVKWLHGYQFYQSDKICCTSIITIIIIITIITIIVIIITMISMISGAFDSVNQSRRQRGVQSS